MAELCTMCEDAEATTVYFAPACQPCHDWLVGLSAKLDQMEAADPELAELGRQIRGGDDGKS